MDRKIKIMVGSTVYGFENELYQIVALLQTLGYEVLNSQLSGLIMGQGLLVRRISRLKKSKER